MGSPLSLLLVVVVMVVGVRGNKRDEERGAVLAGAACSNLLGPADLCSYLVTLLG